MTGNARTPPPQSPPAATRELVENGTTSFPRRKVPVVVRVERGTVLVTREGDLDDHVLEAGDELVLPPGGLAVGWAFTAATISVREDRRRDGAGQGVAPELPRAWDVEALGVTVAHELKNPLTGVKALVQLGLRNPAEARSHERLALLEREITRMQRILQRHLSSSRRQLTRARVALGPLVSDALAVLSARADEARVRLVWRGDATVEADPLRLEEALVNLVANAIEATPRGGEVVVEVLQQGDRAEIAVRDTGRGMRPETLRRVGTPFFTTREDGTGLGVALARSAFAEHGGTLRYESAPGKGTTVRATLPTRPALEAPVAS
jgi:signal transduction histidine kinase